MTPGKAFDDGKLEVTAAKRNDEGKKRTDSAVEASATFSFR
jgi:hypothetical protein